MYKFFEASLIFCSEPGRCLKGFTFEDQRGGK